MIEPTEKPLPKRRNRTLLLFTLIIVVLGLAWIFLWFFFLQYYKWTDDAYANGNMININSAIPGSVVAFYADNTDLVLEGQLIVQLDTTEYQLMYEKEIAALANIVLQVRQLYDNVQTNIANVESKKTALSRAKFDYENRLALIDSLAVSNEEFIHSKEDLLIADWSLRQAESQLQAARAAAGNTELENHPLIIQQKNAIRTAFYNLHHCSIYAPSTGFIAQRTVDVGQWVTPATNMMAVIPTDYVWVDANFKETQLTHMRIGQPAVVHFDLYGSDVKYEGKVLGIASGSGSVFSIIPPQNATGNWIKIVQRLPVRISLDPKMVREFPPRLGISANVRVDISNRDLPMLATAPPKQPVSTTTVFDLNFNKVDQVIDEVICMNMKKAIN